MVILTGKISRGTLMDQIYVPKERPMGFELGMPVVIKPLTEDGEVKPVYYNVEKLESVKVIIVQKVFRELDFANNVIITGSFLEKGFQFNDIDIILLLDKKVNSGKAEQHLSKLFDLNFHVIALDYSTLLKGLETDPIYQAMLSRYVSKKRLIIRYKNKINYKLLDLHLLKSKPLTENFDFLTGNQKYGMARNMIAILLFLNNKKISNKTIDDTIKKLLKEDPKKIKDNMIIGKSEFLQEYSMLYNKLFQKILEGIENGP
ncbi:hypothetical protein HYX08_01255 [Candidatus Woesearchaeota archaeon]|nr:hypothetical protein [Candidatus Woesearchaeota archaeon]